MVTVLDLIDQRADAEAQAGKWDVVAAILNTKDIVRRDITPVTYSEIADTLGDDVRFLIADTLRKFSTTTHPAAGEIADAHKLLLDEQQGLRIHTDARQQLLDIVAAFGNWPGELTAVLKASRVSSVSVAEDSGLGTVTPETCKVQWTTRMLQRHVENWFTPVRTKMRAALTAIDDATATTVEEIDAILRA